MRMKEILFDSNKCFWQRDFGYDSMSLKEFNEYAELAATFIGHFVEEHESIVVDIDRLRRKFRIIVKHNDMNDDEYDAAFCDLQAEYYKNGNVKWIDNFFGILNNEYGLAANNLRIPKFPTSSGDLYYQWWRLARHFRDFRIDSKENLNVVCDKITQLRDKYFTFWIVPGFSE